LSPDETRFLSSRDEFSQKEQAQTARTPTTTHQQNDEHDRRWNDFLDNLQNNTAAIDDPDVKAAITKTLSTNKKDVTETVRNRAREVTAMFPSNEKCWWEDNDLLLLKWFFVVCRLLMNFVLACTTHRILIKK
jgi:hypothetical protein